MNTAPLSPPLLCIIWLFCALWLLLSHLVLSDSLWPHGLQEGRNSSTRGFPVLYRLPEIAQTHVRWVDDAIQPFILLSLSPPAFNLSQHQGLFLWVSSPLQVSKVLELQLQHQSFQWIFRTDFLRDWLVDLLAVQGILKSPLQHHSSKASILWLSAFVMVHLSHPYVNTGKTIALTR